MNYNWILAYENEESFISDLFEITEKDYWREYKEGERFVHRHRFDLFFTSIDEAREYYRESVLELAKE